MFLTVEKLLCNINCLFIILQFKVILSTLFIILQFRIKLSALNGGDYIMIVKYVQLNDTSSYL